MATGRIGISGNGRSLSGHEHLTGAVSVDRMPCGMQRRQGCHIVCVATPPSRKCGELSTSRGQSASCKTCRGQRAAASMQEGVCSAPCPTQACNQSPLIRANTVIAPHSTHCYYHTVPSSHGRPSHIIAVR